MDPRWQDQTTFFDPEQPGKGNCAEACIASLFNIPLAEVPKFYDATSDDPVYRYWRNLENFCFSRGYWLHRMDCEYIFEGTYMVSGTSARGCIHMVVYQNGKLLHDPHPSRKGVEKVTQTWLLVPLDPAKFRRE